MIQALRNIIMCFLLGSFLFHGEAFAQEKETIRWLTWKQVPNFIVEGKFKGQGIADTFTKTLQDKLPQYNHINVMSNTRRYQRLIREENVCVARSWIVPGSRSFRIHSRPMSLSPPTGIQILKSKQHLFGEPGEVLSLEELLANSELKLGYLEGMTYPKKVHELIEQYRGKNNVYFSSINAVEFDLKLLTRNRLDYFFGFPGQATVDAKMKGIPNQYQFYNIKEIDKFVSLHTHCSNTPFGEKVMAEVDKILSKEILLEQLAVVEKWNGENKQYRDVFMEYVIDQKPHKLVTHPGR